VAADLVTILRFFALDSKLLIESLDHWLEFVIEAFTIDPEQDLLILAEKYTIGSPPSFRIHIFSIEDQPHRFALLSVLQEVMPSSAQENAVISLEIMGDTIGLLIDGDVWEESILVM